MSLLLKNAVDSVQIGIEDFLSADGRRDLSAIRNIYAGILLLYKHYLKEMSPPHDKDLLIKSKIRFKRDISGNILPESYGKKTIDKEEIKKRFESLSIYVNWGRLEKISKIRNEVEHYYLKPSAEPVKELISQSFVLIRDFVVEYLKKDPSNLFGSDCWSALLTSSEVFESTEKDCNQKIKKVNWKYESMEKISKIFECPGCYSKLIKCEDETEYSSEMVLICASCLNRFKLSDVLEELVASCFEYENYISAKEGCEPETATCPECGSETYIISEDICLMCEETRAYTTCYRCGNGLSVYEQDFGGLCSYCSHVCSKDD